MARLTTVGEAGIVVHWPQISCIISTNALSSVARIAYLSSDVVLSIQPSLAQDSEFSRKLQALAAEQVQGAVSKQTQVIFPLVPSRESVH